MTIGEAATNLKRCGLPVQDVLIAGFRMRQDFVAQMGVTRHHFAQRGAEDLFFNLIAIEFAAVLLLHFHQRLGNGFGKAGNATPLGVFFLAQRLQITLKNGLITELWA